jgi:putative ABC transport system substrate-binding protein
MDRRSFVGSIVGGLLVVPLAARAQEPATPVIGYLSSRSPGESAHIVAAFRQGLNETGYIAGKNVAIESRFAEGQFDRLPTLAADLVRLRVNVIVATGGTVSVVAAKPVVPETVPMVFAMGGDPVKLGIVASFARPGGHITGVSFLVNGLAAKEIELLHELVPKAAVMGFLTNAHDPNAESDTREAQAAADAIRQKLVVVKASTESDLDVAFSTLVQQRVAALFVDTDPFLTDQRTKIVALAARHALPFVSQLREFAAAGALATYGTSITGANRQLGIYTGRILKGAKPSDLPILQSSKFELIINL